MFNGEPHDFSLACYINAITFLLYCIYYPQIVTSPPPIRTRNFFYSRTLSPEKLLLVKCIQFGRNISLKIWHFQTIFSFLLSIYSNHTFNKHHFPLLFKASLSMSSFDHIPYTQKPISIHNILFYSSFSSPWAHSTP